MKRLFCILLKNIYMIRVFFEILLVHHFPIYFINCLYTLKKWIKFCTNLLYKLPLRIKILNKPIIKINSSYYYFYKL